MNQNEFWKNVSLNKEDLIKYKQFQKDDKKIDKNLIIQLREIENVEQKMRLLLKGLKNDFISVNLIFQNLNIFCQRLSQIDYELEDLSLQHGLFFQLVMFGGSISLLKKQQQQENDKGQENSLENILKEINLGEKIGSVAISEELSGNNSPQIKTTAIYDQDEIIFNSNGERNKKIWISNGQWADYMLLYAKMIKNRSDYGPQFFMIDFKKNKNFFKINQKSQTSGFSNQSFIDLEIKQFRQNKKSCEIITKNEKEKIKNQIQKKHSFSKIDVSIQIIHISRIIIASQIMNQIKYFWTVFQKEDLLVPKQFSLELKADSIVFLTRTFILETALNEFIFQMQNLNEIQEMPKYFQIISQGFKSTISDFGFEFLNYFKEFSSFNQFFSQSNFQLRRIQESSWWGILGNVDNQILNQKIVKNLILGVALKNFQKPTLSQNQQNIPNMPIIKSSDSFLDLLKIKEIILMKKVAYQAKSIAKQNGTSLEDSIAFNHQLTQLTLSLKNVFITRIVAELFFSYIKRIPDITVQKHLKKTLKFFILNYVINNLQWYLLSKIISKQTAFFLQNIYLNAKNHFLINFDSFIHSFQIEPTLQNNNQQINKFSPSNFSTLPKL